MSDYPKNTPLVTEKDSVRVLCLGDIVGRPGRRHLQTHLKRICNELKIDMVIANGENAAGGIGLTPETGKELFDAGVHVITSGNHIWKHKSILPALRKNPHILRPANYPDGAAGSGLCVHQMPCGTQVAVINLIGRTFMEALDCPFKKAEYILSQIPDHVKIRIVDFHAEATSEKRALAHFLDGRVSAVLGTHTHVQTADATISLLGTASLSDLGMCGSERESVLGMQKKSVIERFYAGLPQSFSPAREPASLNGALLVIEKTSGKALSIGLVRDNMPDVYKV